MASMKKSTRLQQRAHTRALTPLSRATNPRHYRQHGAFAVMFVPLLIVIIGFCGLAIDMGFVYNRKVDMHGIARTVALAAARELNGTPAGIAAAKAAAEAAASKLRYYNINGGTPFEWNNEALSFSTSPSATGNWIRSTDTATTSSQAAELLFARVDTADLDREISAVHTFFFHVLANNLASIQVNDSAIAGRISAKLTPIGICAMSDDAAASRTATSSSGTALRELVEHGFRRGISYDLMNLNPNGVEPVRFMINPFAASGSYSQAPTASALAPFVCSGMMWVAGLTGSKVRVSELPTSSPLASFRAPLNTRFDNYAGTACDPNGATPDINIKSYTYNVPGTIKWMSPGSGSAAAAATIVRGRLETVADLPTAPVSPGSYGPLWAYSRAVKAPSSPSTAEPNVSYTAFSPTDWPTLYPSGPSPSNYPTASKAPYFSSSTANGYYLAPSAANKAKMVPHRRVLNIPLLACTPSAPSGSNVEANVLAIGQFFMTVPATDDKLIAEFAGIVPTQSQSGQVVLFQ